ncbi:putative phosphatase [Sphingobium sp. SYK-6]|nr:putative phosphatase [Sphingobium sp. SYK-6]
MRFSALIFDFDGVIADSEYIANRVAAQLVTEIGYQVSTEGALQLFVGKRSSDVREIIERATGLTLTDFEAKLLSRTLDAFLDELEPIKGVRAFLDCHAEIPRCIASSSSHARLNASLAKIDLISHFAGRVFSADDVARGKPFPDLFLYAAKRLGATPGEVLVIEDSVGGVSAAKAAGMHVVGLLAGTHVRPGLSERLEAAGADFLANDYDDVARLLAH